MTGVENSTVPRPDVLTRKRRRTVENGEKITDIQQKNHWYSAFLLFIDFARTTGEREWMHSILLFTVNSFIDVPLNQISPQPD